MTVDGRDMKTAARRALLPVRCAASSADDLQDPMHEAPTRAGGSRISWPSRFARLITDNVALIEARVAELLGFVKLTAKDGEKFRTSSRAVNGTAFRLPGAREQRSSDL